MILFLVILYIGSVAIFCYFVGEGWRARSARGYLLKGVRLAKAGEFVGAREAILIAARQSSAIKADPNVKTLYELVVKREPNSGPEIERLRLALVQLPKDRWEKFSEQPAFQVSIFLLVALLVLLKFLS